jgi:ATP-binding cassette, subfamily C, bacterial LapB
MAELLATPRFSCIQNALARISTGIGNGTGAIGIVHGLPLDHGKLSPDHLEQAVERAGLVAKPLRLLDAKPYHCPLLCIYADGSAVVVAQLKPVALGVVISEDGQTHEILIPGLNSQNFVGCWSLAPLDVLEFQPEELPVQQETNWLLRSLMMQRDILPSIITATVVLNLLALAVPLISMNIMDRVVSHAAFATLWALSLGGVIALAADFLLRSLRGRLIDRSSARSDVLVSNQIFGKVLGAQLSARQNSVGVQSNTLREFDSLREMSNAATVAALGDLPFCLLFLVTIYAVSGALVWVPIAFVPLLLLCGWMSQRSLRQTTAANYRDTAHKNAVAVEVLSNLESIKSRAAESWAASKWERAVASQLRHSLSMRWHMLLSANTMMALQGLTTIAVLVVGVYLISDKQMSPGALFAATMLTGRALTPVAQLAALLSKFHHAQSAYASIRKLVDTSQVLHDISLEIRAGERIAIVGGVGSGKSTLLRTIIGLRAPTSGSVTLDGAPIQQIDPALYRRKFGATFREEGFFHGTLRDNMAFHATDTSDAGIIAAAQMAGAMAWIRLLPKGLDTVIGEAGSGLSSGQRQTLALSRAFIGNPEIYLLDEPTSDVDGRSEQEFVQRLKQLPKEKTLLAVTHRPAMIEACTRLIVIDQGKIQMDGETQLVLARIRQQVHVSRQGQVA